jgi:hypothetical protein
MKSGRFPDMSESQQYGVRPGTTIEPASDGLGSALEDTTYVPVLPQTYRRPDPVVTAPPVSPVVGDRFAAGYAAAIVFGAGSLAAVTLVALVGALVSILSVRPVLDRGPALVVLEFLVLWVAARSYCQVRASSTHE